MWREVDPFDIGRNRQRLGWQSKPCQPTHGGQLHKKPTPSFNLNTHRKEPLRHKVQTTDSHGVKGPMHSYLNNLADNTALFDLNRNNVTQCNALTRFLKAPGPTMSLTCQLI
jgi:hypothetical protein